MPAPTQPPFVGRAAELARLEQRLDAARAGTGGAILVAGEPGIGKTRLLAELAERARSAGCTVLVGRAYQADGLPPYLPFAEALHAYIATTSDDELRDRLDGLGADVAVLMPELSQRLPELAASPMPAELDRYRLFESVAGFLFAIADASPAGLLLVLDDLHWADSSSFLLALHLVRRLPGRRVLVAGTYRDAEVDRGHPLSGLLAELVREQIGEQITLRGLGEGDVERFISLTAELPASAALATALYRETEGNPLFMVELVRLLAAENRTRGAGRIPSRLAIPDSVYQVIGRRLDHLSPSCNAVLTLAAVIGREFDLLALERVGELRGEPLLQVLEEAEGARIIAAAPDVPGRFLFTHPLIRETLYGQILSAQRVRLHRQVATTLEALYSFDPDPHLATLAHHFFQAAPLGEVEKAIAYARRAGDGAMALLAYEEAIRLYGNALQALALKQPDQAGQTDRCALLIALGEAQTRAGETAAGKDTFVQAAELAGRLDLPEQLGRAALGYGGYRWTPGRADERFIALAESALRALAARPGGLRARVKARLAMELYELDARDRRETLSREAVEEARRAGDAAALAAALVGQHYALHEPANLADRLALTMDLVQLAEATGDRELLLQGLYLRTIDLLEAGDVAAAGHTVALHDQFSQELRQPLYLWRTELLRAMQALYEGRFAEGNRLAREAGSLANRAQITNGPAAFGVQYLALRLHTGGLEKMLAGQRAVVARMPAYKVQRAALAMVCALTGRDEEARVQLDELAQQDLRHLPQNDDFFPTTAFLTYVCVSLQNVERAAALYDLLCPYADRLVVVNAATACLGPVSRYLGLLATLLQRWQTAEQHFEQALAVSRSTGSPPNAACAAADYAALLLLRDSAGDRERARPLVEEALAIAEGIGMEPLASELRMRYGRAGSDLAPAPRAGGSDVVAAPPSPQLLPGILSEREAEVLRLLAAGMTNREIADTLVLSTRTVDHHVAAIYRKTAARRRADAAAYAHRVGLVAPPPDD